MKNIKVLAMVLASIITISMIAVAVALMIIGTGGRWELQAIIALLFVCSPLPFLGSLVMLRYLDAYAREIELFSTRDPLTQLYNQVAFWDLLEYEAERSKRQEYRFSLLTLDIDNFKAVNDTYGHETGDAFLKEFSNLFKTAVRKGDIPARLGGDKFAAILPVCDEGQAYSVAGRIMDHVRSFSFTRNNDAVITATASIGIAVYPDHAGNPKDLFLLSDGMMNQAKFAGKDRLLAPGEEDSVDVLRSMGEKSMLIINAVRERNIVPYFQAIMTVESGKIEAYEVLTRITTPERVIPAAEFIEAAEGMGMIGRIDYQLMELAFAKAKQKEYNGRLFINLSPKALVLKEFIPTVRKMLYTYNLNSSKLVFEITERDTIKNLSLFVNVIRELRDEGFRFAIDDFGAGYSSFHYLKAIQVDYLKVDGEFIRSLGGGSSIEKEIVGSIASLSGRLGIKTIAEYVESADILSQVEAAGIHYAQGYFVHRPAPDFK